MSKFTHFDESGRARMVDVGEKPVTRRLALAEGFVEMAPETVQRIRDGRFAKGDVLAVARLAGIMAAKKTADLIPLCHPLSLDSVELALDCEDRGVRIEARCTIEARTGVEMEALTAVSVAALTVYDMCKSVDRGMRLTNIRLRHKSGGRSGDWDAPA